MERTRSGSRQRTDHAEKTDESEALSASRYGEEFSEAVALQRSHGGTLNNDSQRAQSAGEPGAPTGEDRATHDREGSAAWKPEPGKGNDAVKSSIEEAMSDYRSMHRKQYEERLKREREEEEKARRLAEEQRGFELAAKREEENRSATRLAADAEMSRQLFAQLNQHLLPPASSTTTAHSGGAPHTVGTDAFSEGYSSEWLDRLRQQHEEEQIRQQGYSSFPAQPDEDKVLQRESRLEYVMSPEITRAVQGDQQELECQRMIVWGVCSVRPPMRTNYSERLIDDTSTGWLPSDRGFSDSLHAGVGRGGDGAFRSLGNILRGALGVPTCSMPVESAGFFP
ncbi:transmembrane protein, partial [Cystoisospora suis]